MSFIYAIGCTKCNADVEHAIEMDSGNDIYIMIEPCKDCLEEAKNEGIEEGKEDGE